MKPNKRITKLATMRQFQDMIENNQVIFIDRYYNRKCLKSFRNQAKKIIENNPEIKSIAVVINSWGGQTSIAEQVQNEVMALSSKYDVWMIAGAIAASGGAMTFLSVPFERRVALPISSLYNHKPHGSTTERISVNFPEMRYANREDNATIKDTKRTERKIIQQIVEQTLLNKKKAKKLVKRKPRYLSPKKGMKLGFYSAILA